MNKQAKSTILLLALILLVSGAFLMFFVSAWSDTGSLTQNVSGCGVLNTTNGVYTLNQSISFAQWPAAPCLILNASNITLNLNGYNLTGTTPGGGTGIKILKFNVTIFNGTIFGAEAAISTDGAGATGNGYVIIKNMVMRGVLGV